MAGVASIQSQPPDTLLNEVKASLVWAAAVPRNIEVSSLSDGRQTIAVFGFTVADETGPVCGQLWRRNDRFYGSRFREGRIKVWRYSFALSD